MRISELDTPALLIDLDIMERNLRRVASYAAEHDLRLRPHTKTHKSPLLARKQIDMGAVGITVAKVGEAEVMLDANPPDLYVAYPVIGRKKLDRLVEVARRTKVTVGLDSLFAARQLSDAARQAQVEIGILAEVDVGLGRVGVSPGAELLELGKQMARLPWLSLKGISFYPGHIKSVGEDSAEQIAALSALVQQMTSEWKKAGLPLEVVSGGSTPALYSSHRVQGMNEIRPGTYIFNDKNTWKMGACDYGDCAASILVTVVSTARPRQIIIDGGSKTFSSDRLAGSPEMSFGHVVEAPEAVFTKMNEEHGFVDVKSVKTQLAVGDRLRVIPNHVCVAVNLHEQVYGVRGDEVVECWPVAARGKLQ